MSEDRSTRLTFVVGFDGSDSAFDALALARVLAEQAGAHVLVADVYTMDPMLSFPSGMHGVGDALRADAETLLERVREPLGDLLDWSTEAVVDGSAVLGLDALADREDAPLVVVGTSHRRHPSGPIGSTAIRLVHGARCAVAISSRGWRPPAAGLRDVGVGFDGSDESALALRAAADLARRAGATLHGIAALKRPNPADPVFALGPVSYGKTVARLRGETKQRLDAALAAEGADLETDAEVADGDAATVLAERAGSLDLLVVGSRRYGPVRTALLGSVSAQLAAAPPCPLVVVPRGAERVLGAERAPLATSARE